VNMNRRRRAAVIAYTGRSRRRVPTTTHKHDYGRVVAVKGRSVRWGCAYCPYVEPWSFIGEGVVSSELRGYAERDKNWGPKEAANHAEFEDFLTESNEGTPTVGFADDVPDDKVGVSSNFGSGQHRIEGIVQGILAGDPAAREAARTIVRNDPMVKDDELIEPRTPEQIPSNIIHKDDTEEVWREKLGRMAKSVIMSLYGEKYGLFKSWTKVQMIDRVVEREFAE
jgi:hypothetical protein